MTLTPEDKQRIGQEVERYTKDWPRNKLPANKVAFRNGAEYATLYERGKQAEKQKVSVERLTKVNERIQKLEAERTELQGRVDAAYDWLWQYNEELKSTNVFHKNEAIIGRITKLLNSLKTK